MGLVSSYKPESKWLKAEDITAGEIVLTIKAVIEATFDDGRKQPALEFSETDKTLGLNKTNREKLAEMFGAVDPETGMLDVEPDALIGQQISAYKATTQNAQGATVPCVRIRLPRPAAKTAATPADTQPTEAQRREAARVWLAGLGSKAAFSEDEKRGILRAATLAGFTADETSARPLAEVVQSVLVKLAAKPVPAF